MMAKHRMPTPLGPTLSRPSPFGPSLGTPVRVPRKRKVRKVAPPIERLLESQTPPSAIRSIIEPAPPVAVLAAAIAAPSDGQRVATYDHPLATAARMGRASVLWHYTSRTPIVAPSEGLARRVFFIARWRRQLALGRITPAEHVAKLIAYAQGEALP